MKFPKSIKYVKIPWQQVLAGLILLLAFVFFRSERKEMMQIIPSIKSAKPIWLIIGFGITLLYISLQAVMYITSFKAVGLKLKFWDAVNLFLKRNFISVFLPAGGISSLAYLPKQIKKQQFETNKIIQASSIYGFIGLLTVFIIGVPIIIYSIYVNKYFNDSWISLVILGIILILVYFIYNSFKTKNKFYQIIEKKFPRITEEINPIFEASLNRKNINLTILISTIIEITGILHVYIAMLALGIQPTFDAAALAYTISVLLMIISPFLRGLGAVEFTMVYILTQFGYSHNQGLATTLLYRVFEFWLPLGFGCLSFMWRGRKLFARIFPAVMIFTLGMINIISVITPPLAERLHFEKLYLPTEFMHLSKLMILFVGIALLITSSYLIKGLKSAWIFALIFAILSFFGNIFKALDYEEAGFAFLTIVLLIYSRNQYPLKTNLKRLRQGFSIFLLAFFAIFIFNVLSFYFIDKRHFGVDFSWNQAFYYTFQNFLLFSENNLVPRTTFAKDFKDINIFFGFSSWILLILAFFRAKNYNTKGIQDYEEAEEIVEKYGNSALDYFKLMDDKNLYFSSTIDGFVAYKIGLNFAIVLDNVVCDAKYKSDLISEFENYCKTKGLKTAYYRVSENDLIDFKSFKKQHLLIGQEGIIEVDSFNLQGKERKSMRNALNTLEKKGFKTDVILPPLTDDFLNEIESVSNEWLKEFDKKEIVFAEGKFEREILQNQTIITLRNEENKVVTFLNVIPDYAKDEITYDLFRRTFDSPNGSMGAVIIALINHAKENQKKYINIGLTPLAGLDKPNNIAEQLMKFAYQRIGTFKQYQTMRDFKEKYANYWINKYIIYANEVELLQLPQALNKVMKPQDEN